MEKTNTHITSTEPGHPKRRRTDAIQERDRLINGNTPISSSVLSSGIRLSAADSFSLTLSNDDWDLLESSRRSISPPARRRVSRERSKPVAKEGTIPLNSSSSSSKNDSTMTISSPIQLTRIDDLHEASNIDTVSLRDILGHPLIKECWLFNYLFDIDFLMNQFDQDVRDLVQVKVVHGSWKKEDSNKMHIDEAATRYSNLQAITAYMPEAFGTHHSKMIILFRHDDQAQIIILTANILPRDWKMTQALWQSPLLPLLPTQVTDPPNPSPLPPLGTGVRFKYDLLAYLLAYGIPKTGPLITHLKSYAFDSIRGALIASVPSKLTLHPPDQSTSPLWGWPSLKRALGIIPSTSTSTPHIMIQVSSVASIGEKWPQNTFLPTLATTSTPTSNKYPPKFSLIFPTTSEIRDSRNGYSSGGSIHMRTQSLAQQKQLAYFRPMLCHWGHPTSPLPIQQPQPSSSQTFPRSAHRTLFPPHQKTYLHFSSPALKTLDWALLTSANLSLQAWGAAPNSQRHVRVCSYEIGVLVWPALWGEDARMVPVFGADLPTATDVSGMHDARSAVEEASDEVQPLAQITVGWRMGYDLPPVPYAEDEMPWCATLPSEELDSWGRSWGGG